MTEELRVKQRITDMGFYYSGPAGEELGPFTVQEERSPTFDNELAAKLGDVELKDIFLAGQRELLRPGEF